MASPDRSGSALLSAMRAEWVERNGNARERFGFYLYDLGNSCYSTVAIAMYILLFLQAIADEHANGDVDTCSEVDGVSCKSSRQAWSDGTASCTKDGAPYTGECRVCIEGESTRLWDGDTGTWRDGDMGGRVNFFGGSVSPFAFASFTLAISVAFQAVVFITTGAWADYGTMRRKGLTVFTLIGCAATTAFLLVLHPSLYWLGGLLAIVSNCAYGSAVVYYNSYLPLLVDDHPAVAETRASVSAGGAALAKHETEREYTENMISSIGFSVGYVGSVVTVLISLVPMALSGSGALSELWAYRINIGVLVGLWWLGWSYFAIKRLGVRPGKPLKSTSVAHLLGLGWRNTCRTILLASKYRDTALFMLMYFFYSDTYSTIASVGILIARQYACMGPIELVLVMIEAVLCAMIGNIFYLWLQRRYAIQTKNMICINLLCYAALCALGLVGISDAAPIGLKNKWEFYVFALVHGVQLGAVQSFSRSLLADLSVPGCEAEFFALYEITDKSSS